MNYCRAFYISFTLLVSAASLFAQEPVALDKVILKDGSELKGEIISREASLILELEDGQEVIIPLEDIRTIEPRDPDKLYFPNGAFLRTRGWYHQARLAFGGGGFSSQEGGSSTGLEWTSGYQLNAKIGLGIGLGINVHTSLFSSSGEIIFLYTTDRYQILPVYGEIKITPWQKKVAPYLGLQSGYGIGTDLSRYWEDHQGAISGGFMGGASMGLRIATRKRSGFLFELQYRMQQARGERNDPNGFYRITNIDFHRLLIGIGWSF